MLIPCLPVLTYFRPNLKAFFNISHYVIDRFISVTYLILSFEESIYPILLHLSTLSFGTGRPTRIVGREILFILEEKCGLWPAL